jgi:hypothetical protein
MKTPQWKLEANKRWRQRNPEKVKAIKRAQYDKNPAQRKERNAICARKYRALHPARLRDIMRKSRYKVLPSRPCPEHCECCGVPFAETRHGACFDHDHKTGLFRGWLCNFCNTGLGRLGDCREGVIRMLEYLDHSELLQ